VFPIESENLGNFFMVPLGKALKWYLIMELLLCSCCVGATSIWARLITDPWERFSRDVSEIALEQPECKQVEDYENATQNMVHYWRLTNDIHFN